MNKINQLFNTIATKLDIYESFLHPGASIDQIQKVEKVTGLKVPETLSLLLQRCNGEKKFLGFLGHMLLSSEEIIIQWQQKVKIFNDQNFNGGPEIIYQKDLISETSFYHPNRLPFAHDGSGQYLCIDYFPGPQGIAGQVVYIPMGEPEPMSVIAANFDDFLSFITKAIETDKIALMDDRADYKEEEQHFAEVYFYKTWKQDWTEIADQYSQDGKIG